MIVLIGYLLYALIFSIIIFAFRNPNEKKEVEVFPDNLQNKYRKTGDRVQLIESAKDGAMIRVKLIEDAKTSVDISYFTFRNGEVSRAILGSVLNAADRGVKVRILLDSLSALPSLANEFGDILYGLELHENISLKFYDPVNPLFPFNWSRRLHDKLIVIDENLALMGGRNVADNYFLGDVKWRTFSDDRDVLIFKDESSGDYYSAIEDMKNYYDETWNYRYSRPFIRKLGPRKKAKVDLAIKDLKLENIKIKYDYEKEINWFDHTIAVEDIDFVHNPVGKINQDP